MVPIMIFFLGIHMSGRADKRQGLSSSSSTPPGAEGLSEPRWGLLDACLGLWEVQETRTQPLKGQCIHITHATV